MRITACLAVFQLAFSILTLLWKYYHNFVVGMKQHVLRRKLEHRQRWGEKSSARVKKKKTQIFSQSFRADRIAAAYTKLETLSRWRSLSEKRIVASTILRVVQSQETTITKTSHRTADRYHRAYLRNVYRKAFLCRVFRADGFFFSRDTLQ